MALAHDIALAARHHVDRGILLIVAERHAVHRDGVAAAGTQGGPIRWQPEPNMREPSSLVCMTMGRISVTRSISLAGITVSCTGASALSENKLFATLDPTTRRLRLPTNQNVLLSDTVGFIRKLPHDLVDAFKATLEEVIEADLLLHVVDISSPQAEEQIEAVNVVLDELGVADKPMLMVFNKVDRVTRPVWPGASRSSIQIPS